MITTLSPRPCSQSGRILEESSRCSSQKMTYRSVAASCVTLYWIGVSRFFSSLLSTLIAGDGFFLKLQNFLLIFSVVRGKENPLRDSSDPDKKSSYFEISTFFFFFFVFGTPHFLRRKKKPGNKELLLDDRRVLFLFHDEIRLCN